MHKKITAFSLIELSIVILIIGILVAGVTQSSRLVKRMNINSARTQTMSSPVNSIRDIVGWWEASLEESFGGNEPEEDSNGGTDGVSVWYDINPHTTTKNNATSASTTNNPGYTQQSTTTINGMPTLEFNGSNQYLRFDGTSLANSNYSVFIVEQRTTGTGDYKYMLASSDNPGVQNQLLQIGYRNDTTLTWGQFANDYDITVASYTSPTPRIHAAVFNSSATSPKIYFINGAQQTLNVNGSPTASQGLTSYTNATFGFYGTGQNVYYKGNIGEIIIFNRALKTEERRSIEEYLSKKWKIKIS
jgi:prepilin-type N-terminal cleavage/methylation domain-containing protein